MRVLLVTNVFPNPWHANRGTYNRLQFAALSQEHPVHVISPVSWTDELKDRRLRPGAMPHGRHAVYDGLPTDHPRYLFLPKWGWNFRGPAFARSIARSFARAVEKHQPDVVVAAWAYPDGWATIRLARKHKLPVAVKVHGTDVNAYVHLAKPPARVKETMHQADAVIAVCQDLAAKACRLGASSSRVHVVHNGLDATIFSPGAAVEARVRLGLPAHVPMILFVGNLKRDKGAGEVLSVCRSLVSRQVAFQCHMVGSGPAQAEVARQITEFGLGKQVHLQGSVLHQALPDWYRAASAVLLPTQSEGIPNVLLEANATGVPFVASNVGGIPEIPRQPMSALVAPGDTAEFTLAVSRLLASAAERDARPGSAIDWPSWRDSSKRLASVLQHVIGSPQAT